MLHGSKMLVAEVNVMMQMRNDNKKHRIKKGHVALKYMIYNHTTIQAKKIFRSTDECI